MRILKKVMVVAVQVGLLFLLSWAGNALVGRFGWPVPGNIVGMLLMLLLLQTGIVRLEWVEAGAGWLLGEMLLFFIPAAVGIIQYGQLMATSGGRILLVILLSTTAVMVTTGLLADRLARQRGKRGPEDA